VEDSGFGIITPERIFEAFFTSKHEGLGVGLSISRSIAEAHGGALVATNLEDRGVRFSLTLPRSFSPLRLDGLPATLSLLPLLTCAKIDQNSRITEAKAEDVPKRVSLFYRLPVSKGEHPVFLHTFDAGNAGREIRTEQAGNRQLRRRTVAQRLSAGRQFTPASCPDSR
jgi:hypothetical protein